MPGMLADILSSDPYGDTASTLYARTLAPPIKVFDRPAPPTAPRPMLDMLGYPEVGQNEIPPIVAQNTSQPPSIGGADTGSVAGSMSAPAPATPYNPPPLIPLGLLSSMGGQQLPQSATPTVGPPLDLSPPPSAPPQAPPTTAMSGKPAIPQGSLLDRIGQAINDRASTLMAMGAGLSGAQSIGQGLSRGFAGAIPAMQQDIQLQRQNQTVEALKRRGIPPDVAMAAAGNPMIMSQLVANVFGPKQWSITETTDMFGQKKPILVNPVTGEAKELSVHGLTGSGDNTGNNSAPGVPQTLANFDASKINPNAQGMDYLKQWPQEVQAATRAYMSGDVMPTGNPRNNNISSIAKTVAQKVAMDLGQPNLADDALYMERRKMRADLGASAPNSAGGILANGKSAFEHLANLSDKYVDLGNYNGPPLPGGGMVAHAGNVIGNFAGTSEQQAKIQAASDNAMKYGAEATKFYAGSGGGEAERLSALHNINPLTSSSNEQGAFLQTEKELMLGRLKQKEAQIRDVLGQQYLDQHPVVTKDLQATLDKIDANIVRLRGGQASAAPTASNAITSGALKPDTHYMWGPGGLVPVQ